MRNLTVIIVSVLAISACTTKKQVSSAVSTSKVTTSVTDKSTTKTKNMVVKNDANKTSKKEANKTTADPKLLAEQNATPAGKAILEIGRKMALEEKVIIKGGCWNWVNECFKRAGYGTERHIAFKSKKSGPYVNTDEIQAGDWLYYINHSYGGVEHSGIFIYWVDKAKKIGVTLSYAGEQRKEPGRYREYLLKDVYYITRPGKK